MNELHRIFRSFRQTPAFACVAVVTLALGIGLNTTMASLFEALLWRPAPFANPETLLRLEGVTSDGSQSGLSVPEINALTESLSDFAEVIPFRWIDATFTQPGMAADNRVAVAVTGNFFAGMGVPAALGRTFDSGDLSSPDAPLLVLSHEVWRNRFDSDPAAIGSAVRINGRAYTLIGVMPEEFGYRRLWGYGELWVPGDFMQQSRDNFEARQHSAVARLKPGVTIAQLNGAVAATAERLAREHAASNARQGLRAVPLHESTVSPSLRRLTLLTAGVSLVVLIIICVNLANLQLSRALARRRELALRSALGASPARLLRDVLNESLVLGAAGCVIGLILAVWVNRILSSVLVIGLGGRVSLELGWPVLLGAVFLSLFASACFGLAPAILAVRTQPQAALKQEARGTTATGGAQRLRRGFVIFEIALALTLLTGAVILIRSFGTFLDRPAGWDTDGIAFATVTLPAATYPDETSRREFHRALQAALREQPGVSAAALCSLPPVYSFWMTRNVAPYGEALGTGGVGTYNAYVALASPGFFDALRLPVLEGRAFPEEITADSPPVLMINESFARALWPDESAVGKRLMSADGSEVFEVIGVVKDIVFPANPDSPLSRYVVYKPFIHEPWPFITMAVRGEGGRMQIERAMRAAVASLDLEVAVQECIDVDLSMERELRNVRLLMATLAVFAGFGFLLAGLGVYGVIEHGVSQRRTEFGIRLALGAPPRHLSLLVIREAVLFVATGIGIGLLGAFFFQRLLASVLPEVTQSAPEAFVAIAAVMGGSAALASWLPARRAARLDPAEVLR